MKNARVALFLLPLILLLTAGLVQSALGAAEFEAAAPFESTAEISEEGEVEEECVEEFEEGEEDEEAVAETEEECEDEAEESSRVSAEDCLLRTTHARVVAFPSRNQVRLTLGYTTYAPAQATVEYKASHDRLGAATRHLGRSGVVRLSKHLDEKQMSRVRGSGRFTVTVHVSDVPGACQRFESDRLAVDRRGGSKITWGEDD